MRGVKYSKLPHSELLAYERIDTTVPSLLALVRVQCTSCATIYMVSEKPHVLPIDIQLLLYMGWEIRPSVDDHANLVWGQPWARLHVNRALWLMERRSHHILAPMAA